MSESESESESDSENTRMTVPDEDLPEDVQPGEDNPLAEPADDDAERQDMGDPHMPGLERGSDDNLAFPDADDEDPTGES